MRKIVILTTFVLVLVMSATLPAFAAPSASTGDAAFLNLYNSYWSDTSSSSGVPSGWSGTWFGVIFKLLFKCSIEDTQLWQYTLNSYSQSTFRSSYSVVDNFSISNGSSPFMWLRTQLDAVNYNIGYLGSQFYNSSSSLNTALTAVPSIKTNTDSIASNTLTIKSNVIDIASDTSSIASDTSSIATDTSHISSNTDSLVRSFTSLLSSVEKFVYLYADDDTIAAKRAEASKTNQVASDFVLSSGTSSASASDFGSLSSGVTDLKDSLSGGASPSEAFTVLSNSSNAWGWFSTDVQNDLDQTNTSTSGGPARVRSRVSSHPLYDNYVNFIFSRLGGDALND